MKEKLLTDFLMWLNYNNPRIDRISENDFKDISEKFIKATSGKNKYCECKVCSTYSINDRWDDWHCTYCLKPIKK